MKEGRREEEGEGEKEDGWWEVEGSRHTNAHTCTKTWAESDRYLKIHILKCGPTSAFHVFFQCHELLWKIMLDKKSKECGVCVWSGGGQKVKKKMEGRGWKEERWEKGGRWERVEGASKWV